MPIGTTTTLNMIADITLAVFSAALVLVILWQDPRRRSSQYFALCMAIFALYGGAHTVWQVTQQIEADPHQMLKVTSGLYVMGVVLLFPFIGTFGNLPLPVRHWGRAVSLLAGIIFIALLWDGQLYRNFEPIEGGSYRYDITPLGVVGVVVLNIYLLAIIALLQRQNNARTRELSIPVMVLVFGNLAFAAMSAWRELSVNTLATTIAVLMLGRTVIEYRVFKPLADLNDELARKNDQLAEASRMKSQFLANMSHELRTPLNSIIGYTELVTQRMYGELNERQVDRLHKVTRNGRMLLELINDVLDLSKIEAGRLELNMASVSATDLLDDVLKDYEPRALEKGLALVHAYGPLPDLWVDQARTRQILAHLLANAVKFTEQGAIIVRGYYDAEKHRVVFNITDTGIGIEPEKSEQIFEAFTQADPSPSRRYEGTGLGLSIAQRLTDLHNGQLWFESTPGVGSQFNVALPVTGPVPPPGRALPPQRARGPLVLVIDNDAAALTALKTHLETKQLRVYATPDPNEGLRLAHKLRPALVVLDVEMSALEGWCILEALRHDPATATLPVLVISDFEPNDGQPVLVKPVQPAALLAAVNEALAHEEMAL